jgi:alkaline phosphatase D
MGSKIRHLASELFKLIKFEKNRNMKIYALSLFCAVVALSCAPSEPAVFTVAFGSCNQADQPNDLWDDVLATKPDVFVWGGDVVYADTDQVDELKSAYALQLKVPGYQSLMKQVPVIGTWDDHDYGLNDGGAEFSIKKESQQVFLDFMQVPQDDSRRSQPGVYALHDFSVGDQTVRIIVLDTRFFRSALRDDPSGEKRYLPTDQGTMLGDSQWAWLENSLTNSPADVHILMSSIQFLSGEHGFESWANLSAEQQKLEDLIVRTNPKGFVLLSGDRHISEFSTKTIPDFGQPIIDFTSSGLTHSYSSYRGEPNQYRLGEVLAEKSFGLLRIDLKARTITMEMVQDSGQVARRLVYRYPDFPNNTGYELRYGL